MVLMEELCINILKYGERDREERKEGGEGREGEEGTQLKHNF